MGIAASELRRSVIRPALNYLDRHTPQAETFLLCVAACQSAFGSALDDASGRGLYRITDTQHGRLWDDYLAADPELASRVRGLASQHAFLAGPHLELTVNLRYATAIAWLLVEAAGNCPASESSALEMAHIWRKVFQPAGQIPNFIDAWRINALGITQNAASNFSASCLQLTGI